MLLLAPIPWAQRVWALPFLTVLAPSERYDDGRKQQHKQLTDWAHQQKHLWPVDIIGMSPDDADVVKIPRALFDRLTDTLAFTA